MNSNYTMMKMLANERTNSRLAEAKANRLAKSTSTRFPSRPSRLNKPREIVVAFAAFLINVTHILR